MMQLWHLDRGRGLKDEQKKFHLDVGNNRIFVGHDWMFFTRNGRIRCGTGITLPIPGGLSIGHEWGKVMKEKKS